MGLLEKLSQKMGDAMEKSAAKNMTGSSKEVYENEKKDFDNANEDQKIGEMVEFKFEKNDLNDLESLLLKGKFIDSQLLWIAGFPNFKTNQNAVAANLLTGKKNLQFLCINQEIYYFVHFEKDYIKTYRIFNKSDIKIFELKSKLFGTDTFKIELNDKKIFTISVTENKDKVRLITNYLK